MAKTAQEKLDAKAEKQYYKTHKRSYKLTPGDIVFNILNYGFFIIFTLSCIFPFYYLFINTISSNDLVSRGLINFVPRGINLDNYVNLVKANEIGQAFFVSIGRTILGTALMVMASAFVGYLVTKQQLWHRKFWYRFLVITMYFNAGTIPWYLNMSMLGLTNNFMAYIIPGIVAPYNIILVKTYIESIPAELEESAFMDGAGYWTIFRKIIWPLSMPILATIAIFGAVGHWNSFTDSLILMQNAPELYTLQHRLYLYLTTSSNIGALMNGGVSSSAAEGIMQTALNAKVIRYTVSMVSIIPILLVYPFMQRYFVKGIMLGAVKG
ncbi:MAG: carbohydrate ABC transporter permease [Lachnospiraceae bacterium]|nr:carbohydrate ABC transporter permease [Lachnospiraceae bacterium]